MELKYFRSTWGLTHPTLEANLRQIKAGGFDGVEMAAPSKKEEREIVRKLLNDMGLDLIVQQYTQGKNLQDHIRSFEEQYHCGAELSPRWVNSHTGKDHFTLEENLAILNRAAELEKESGVPVIHEIHRGRMTFSAPATEALILRFPEIRLVADFSHWCCVHESLLQDQIERVNLAIQHSVHIHARIGHPEGPQVNDPRAPEWKETVAIHLDWWQKIINTQKARGAKVFTITPEFGPPGYMPTLPFTQAPVTDLWEVNVFMRELLKEKLEL